MSGELNGWLIHFQVVLRLSISTCRGGWEYENSDRNVTNMKWKWQVSENRTDLRLLKSNNNSGFKISVHMFCKVSGLIRERKETYCFSIFEWHSISFQKTSTEECLTGHDRRHLFDVRGCIRKSETLYKPTVSGLSNQCHFFRGKKILQNWQHCGLWVF